MARRRNDKPLMGTQAKLAGDFIPLMRGVAAEFIRNKWYHDFEELTSVGSMILTMAARGYDAASGWTFEAYAREALKNGYFAHIREEKRWCRIKWDGVRKISPGYTSSYISPTTVHVPTSTPTPTRRPMSRIVVPAPTVAYIDPHTICAHEPSHSEEERAHFRHDLAGHLRKLFTCILVENAMREMVVMIGMVSARLLIPNLLDVFENVKNLVSHWDQIESGQGSEVLEALRLALAPHNEGKEVSLSIKQLQELTRKTYQSLLWAITHDKLSGFKKGSQWRVNLRDARVFAGRVPRVPKKEPKGETFPPNAPSSEGS